MVNFKSCVSFSLLLYSGAALAVDESRLWLPKTYHSKYIDLVKAAAAAENLERCVDVLEGTIDLSQSTKQHPKYRILCRQPNGRSYNEMVDGLTFEPHNKPDPEAEERQRRREEQKRRIEFVQLCEDELAASTKKMIDFMRITEEQPEPHVWEPEEAQYQIDFDAKNIWGDKLRYRALCTVSADKKVEMEILKRRD